MSFHRENPRPATSGHFRLDRIGCLNPDAFSISSNGFLIPVSMAQSKAEAGRKQGGSKEEIDIQSANIPKNQSGASHRHNFLPIMQMSRQIICINGSNIFSGWEGWGVVKSQ